MLLQKKLPPSKHPSFPSKTARAERHHPPPTSSSKHCHVGQATLCPFVSFVSVRHTIFASHLQNGVADKDNIHRQATRLLPATCGRAQLNSIFECALCPLFQSVITRQQRIILLWPQHTRDTGSNTCKQQRACRKKHDKGCAPQT